MTAPNTNAISKLLHQYRGVEGFYFLNRNGELGYINGRALRSVKETFPQLNNRDFLRMHPHFMQELEGFLRGVGDLSTMYLGSDPALMEIGYVLPASDNQTWHSATLVLHKDVVTTIQQDEKLLYAKGLKNPFHTDVDAEKMKGVRSIQQGLDDLVNHRDAFGAYKYFPVLFSGARSDQTDDIKHARPKLRVLNLKWHPVSPSGADQRNISLLASFETVFSVLRANLVARGAIDRSKRLQNRFVAF